MYTKVICFFFLFQYTQSKLLELSCDDIVTFVKAHNIVRLMLAEGRLKNQPPASEMNSMVWDEELAAKAAQWASIYPKTINSDQTIPSQRFLTSQSISVLANDDRNVEFDLKIQQVMWFAEHMNYTYGPFTREIIAPSHPPVGHYTQMVWSNAIHLGCAISENIENDIKWIYVVCEYGPSANTIGQVPYKTGPPSKKLTCAAGEEKCNYPYTKKCLDE